jgi:hypothetical protein
MPIQELSKEQYLATMDMPMRFIEAGDTSYGPFPIGECMEELIKTLALPTTMDDIEIHAVYINDKKGYVHILFNWGVANLFFVLVTKPSEKEIYGYRFFLDLGSEYGLNDGQDA